VKEEIKKAEEKITESSKDGKEVSASEKLLAESKTKLTEAEATDDSTLKEKLLEEAEDLAKEARMKFIGKSIDDIEEKSDERTTIIDDQGREVEVRTKTKTKGDRTETEERQTFVDENGNKIEIRTKTVMKDGKEEVVVKRKVESPDGTEITLKTKTEVREGRERVTNTIEVKGVEVTTELSVREENRADRAIVKAKLSTGAEQDIIVLPDEVILTAFEELQATDNFVFELNEVVDGDTRKAAFSAKASKPGKLLGVFNTQVDLETLIDTVTGEIIKTERPWWAFLVVEADDAVVCHVIGANKVKTLDVAIPAVKSHLEHGDNVGKCSAFCGDSILVEGVESCEVDDTQACTTAEGYSGTATCDLTCTGFDTCVSAEFCGDSVVNGNEACDDGDVIAGDGCDASCQIEVPVGSSTVA